MRRLLVRSHSIYPVRQCHFCSVSSQIVPPHPELGDDFSSSSSSTSAPLTTAKISSGSAENWFCSSCQCWNRVDESQVGGIATWEQKMSDEKQNIQNFQRRGTVATTMLPSSSSNFASISPFCHSCQTNQTLILSIMANGEVGGMDEDAIQQWQSSLESRYPPVCETCSEMVKDRIGRADQLARRLIWNAWLSKRRGRITSTSTINDLSTSSSNVERTESVAKLSSVGLVWVTGCLAFNLSMLLSASFAWKRPEIGSVAHGQIVFALLLMHLFASQWDPTFPRQLRMYRRLSPASSVTVKGRKELRVAQTLVLIIRLLHISMPLHRLFSTSSITITHLNWSLSTLSIISQLFILIRAFYHLHVVEPHHISLKSRIPSTFTTTTPDGPPAHGTFSLLSLDSEKAAMINDSQIKEQTLPNTTERETEEMDWAPTPVSISTRVDDNFQLGPQRFFEPLKKTGLEDLMDRHLALDDDESKVTEAKLSANSKVFSTVLVFWTMTLFSLLLAVTAIFLGPNQFRATVSPLITHWLTKGQTQLRQSLAAIR